jgi:hypothetical protein
MVENDWLTALDAKEQLHRAYVKITGMPIIPTLKAAATRLQDFVESIESSDGFGNHGLERLLAIHATSNAARAMAAIQICEALIFRALAADALQSRPVGEFTFYRSGGRELRIGLCGRARTVPAKFWERFRQAEDSEAEWATGQFTFGRNQVGFAYGNADGVLFDPVGLAVLERDLESLFAASQTGAVKSLIRN